MMRINKRYRNVPFYCTNSIPIGGKTAATYSRMAEGYCMSKHVPITNRQADTRELYDIRFHVGSDRGERV